MANGAGRIGMAAAVALLCAAAVLCSAFVRPDGGHRQRYSWTELQKRYDGAFVLSAPRTSRKVALTFDDVPDPRFTPGVLDVLKGKGVKATFFVVGWRADKHPALLRRIAREGHAVGNHSYDHPDFSKLRLGQVQTQIDSAGEAIERVIGFRPRFVRPPYGEITPAQLSWAKRSGYTIVNWDVDSRDWRQLSADRIYANVTRAVRPGSVILLHAGGGVGQDLSGTVEALPRIIDWLRANRYEPVTVPELLGMTEAVSAPNAPNAPEDARQPG